jgi:ribonuclease R
VDHYVEGLVHVSGLSGDFYRFVEGSHTLMGERTARAFRLGDHVRVQIARVDMDRRMIDLALEQPAEQPRDEGPGLFRGRTRPTREPRKAAADERRPRRKQRPGRQERAQKKKR